jgi:L-threonylcarbamoyladenylate synthase
MKNQFVSTSATFQANPPSFKEISPEIIKGVDYVVNLHKDKIAGNHQRLLS